MNRRSWSEISKAWLVALGGWLLLPSASAQAHTTFPGLGEFASGFLHPLTTPIHLLLLLALGLWLGQHPPLRLKAPAGVAAITSAAGLLLTVIAHIGGVPSGWLVALILGVALSVATDVPVSLWVKTVTCGVAVCVLGMDSGLEASVTGPSVAKILSATWISLVLCLVNIAFYVSLLPAVRPVQIGVRVLGSWIVAIAFLLLAFALRR